MLFYVSMIITPHLHVFHIYVGIIYRRFKSIILIWISLNLQDYQFVSLDNPIYNSLYKRLRPIEPFTAAMHTSKIN